MRCEDFPCCGHQLGECPTGPSKECPDCGRLFEPCSLGESYCLACGQEPSLPKFTTGPMPSGENIGKCTECGFQGSLYWVNYGRRHDHICEGCVDDYGQAAADDAFDRQHFGD